MTLRVGIYASPSPDSLRYVLDAESIGVDSIWVAEYWGYDALTPLAFLAGRTSRVKLATAIVQLGARSPAMLAMSAMSLQTLSGGRFILGVGTSGPQIMEGWHGVEFTRPIQRTRETIEIVRQIVSAAIASNTAVRSTTSRRGPTSGRSEVRPTLSTFRSTWPRSDRPILR